MIWYRQSVATLVCCRKLAENYVTVMPSVTCVYYVGAASCSFHINSIGFSYQDEWEM